MNIISGKYKRKKIKGFDIDGTRPTMNRVRESLFAMISPYLKDAVVLDLFAGSGLLGIEALSNGAKKVYFVDKNPLSIKIVKENLVNVEEEYELLNMDFLLALKKINAKFDIIFLDPPYKNHLINKALLEIEKNNLLSSNGIVICEYEDEEVKSELEVLKEKKYSKKNIKILKNSRK